MSRKLISSPSAITKSSPVEHMGNCVVCKLGIFSDHEWGRAPKPLLGRAHAWCGGLDRREQVLAEQFPPVEVLERERPGLGRPRKRQAAEAAHRAQTGGES